MRFTKVGLALMAVLVTSASVTWAMDARKQVLDLGQAITGENTPASLVLDSSDAFTNPALMLSYANLLGLEGTAAINNLVNGFAFADLSVVGVPGVLGIQIGRNFGLMKTATLSTGNSLNNLNSLISPMVPNVNLNIDGNPTVTILSNDVQPYGILYALNLMDVLQVGAAVNFVGNSIKVSKTRQILPRRIYPKASVIWKYAWVRW